MSANENPLSAPNIKTPRSYTAALGWTILILDLIVTLGLWYFVNENVKNEALGRFQFRSQEIQVAIEERLAAYEQVLRGGVALFESTKLQVDREMFKTYVDNLNIEERYRGIQGIGFAIPVSPEEKDNHIREVRESGYPDYTIKPEGGREQYTSIIYLEPFSGRNLRAFGYDMYSEPIRRDAMKLARDTGLPSISGRVILVQETNEDVQTGFLLYLPVYKKNVPLNTVEERRSALFGYVYSAFRTRDFLEGVLGQRKIPDLAFSLFVLNSSEEKILLYNSNPEHDATNSIFKETRGIDFQKHIYRHIYSLELNSLKPFEDSIEKEKSIAVLIVGLLVSLVFFTVLWLTHTAKTRAVQHARKLNESLSASERRLRDILDLSPTLIFIKDLQGRYTFSNRENEMVTGIPRETIVGKTTQEVFPKQIADQFDANDKKVIETLVPQVVEEVVPQKEGPPLSFLSTQFPLFDANNKPYAICGISTDITERKLAEQKLLKHQEQLEELVSARTQEIQKALIELRESEERLNLTFEATSEGIWDWNIQTGEVLFSSQWFKSLGYEPGEFIGHVDSWKKLVHPEDMPDVMEKLNAHFAGKTESYECVYRLKTKSGAWRWNLDRGKVVVRDSEGRPIRMVGADSDISQLKKYQDELENRESELAHAQRMAQLGSWTFEVQGKKLTWSDEIYRIFEWDQKKGGLTYEKYLMLVHKDDRKAVHLANRDSILGKKHYDIEYRIVTPNGEVKLVRQKSKTQYDREGYPLKVVGITHDISKIKFAEQELLINREKFRLLYNQISQVLEGTSSATSGEKFFQSLAFHLASTLGVSYCLIGKLDQKFESCGTLAFCKDGKNIQNFQYKLRGTPCEIIYQGTTVFYPDKLQEAFPSDCDLEELGVKSYFGVPVIGPKGLPIAHIAVMAKEPMPYSSDVMSILSLFAARAGAELVRMEIKDDLRVSQKRLRELNNKMQSVREQEKLHLAREIHDELGQVITYCKLDLLWIKKEINHPGEKIEKKLESVVSHLDDTLNRVRKISSELRPEILDVMGISEAMKWQAEKFKKQTNIEYDMYILPEKFECDRDRSIDLFRIFQETLTNISRHSQATFVEINFMREPKCYRLVVKDNGKGFVDTSLENHSHSLGILGMRERSLNWGGYVDIRSQPGKGTTVTVNLPKKGNHDLSPSE